MGNGGEHVANVKRISAKVLHAVNPEIKPLVVAPKNSIRNLIMKKYCVEAS